MGSYRGMTLGLIITLATASASLAQTAVPASSSALAPPKTPSKDESTGTTPVQAASKRHELTLTKARVPEMRPVTNICIGCNP
ncbi:hypothetical protein Mnod_0821 [Methylobacterium nodulans ORS 2060]|uniref:Uncharacterized protein n=1 Tax=Methylobacterium nodulans (strain LMG 21967 / CNCM I-2342 / ORS 2060) TaxID=460265 RepID=B8IGF1_METNO|nr:hypothetical protein Mnod_0821 [Methylobacterium nodulans ORS 2060]